MSNKQNAVNEMLKAGWKSPIFGDITDSFYMDIPLREDDRSNLVKYHGKNHFSPYGYRSVYITHCAKDSFYATSDARGDFRLYRGRHTTQGFKGGTNIFATGKTWDDVVANFLKAYASLEYNRS